MRCPNCEKEYNSQKALLKHFKKCTFQKSIVSIYDIQGNELYNKYDGVETLDETLDFEKIYKTPFTGPRQPPNQRSLRHIAAVKKMLLKSSTTEMEAYSIYLLVCRFYPHFSENEVAIAREKVLGFFPADSFVSGRLTSFCISLGNPQDDLFDFGRRQSLELYSFLDNY